MLWTAHEVRFATATNQKRTPRLHINTCRFSERLCIVLENSQIVGACLFLNCVSGTQRRFRCFCISECLWTEWQDLNGNFWGAWRVCNTAAQDMNFPKLPRFEKNVVSAKLSTDCSWMIANSCGYVVRIWSLESEFRSSIAKYPGGWGGRRRNDGWWWGGRSWGRHLLAVCSIQNSWCVNIFPFFGLSQPWQALARMARAMAANAGAVLGPDGEVEDTFWASPDEPSQWKRTIPVLIVTYLNKSESKNENVSPHSSIDLQAL